MGQSAVRKPPSLLLTLTEWRAIFELNSFLALRLLMKKFPKGDGHPVLVLPGFMASDASTRPMRGVLKDLGYSTYGWKLGRNLKLNKQREEEMSALITDIYEKEGRGISIVGWSLGGLFAREIAKFHPDMIRSVISLGSPIVAGHGYSAPGVRAVFDAINGPPEGEYVERFAKSGEAPPVPTTSIYSKSDGIVAWEGSIQDAAPLTENIEVPASHFGLGVNPLVIYAIADRLAQEDGAWQPFEVPKAARLLYPATPKKSAA